MTPSCSVKGPDEKGGCFEPSHWSIILAAGSADSPNAAQAQELICSSYWKPIYVYLRGQGKEIEDAKDLTQEFFARLLAANAFRGVDPAKGRFRSFLLASLKHFLCNQHDRAGAIKRGGGLPVRSLETQKLDSWCQEISVTAHSADAAFDRQWALTLVEQTLAQLRKEAEASNKLHQFEQLKVFLTSESAEQDYSHVSQELNLNPNAIGVAVHRLRQRFRSLIYAH